MLGQDSCKNTIRSRGALPFHRPGVMWNGDAYFLAVAGSFIACSIRPTPVGPVHSCRHPKWRPLNVGANNRLGALLSIQDKLPSIARSDILLAAVSERAGKRRRLCGH